MASIMISNSASFGNMTNQVVARLTGLNSMLPRLMEAIAVASSGYVGTPGTEFETAIPSETNAMPMPNNFQVQADPTEPGKKGTDYAYAVDTLGQAWATFWTAAEGAIQQLDNGQYSM